QQSASVLPLPRVDRVRARNIGPCEQATTYPRRRRLLPRETGARAAIQAWHRYADRARRKCRTRPWRRNAALDRARLSCKHLCEFPRLKTVTAVHDPHTWNVHGNSRLLFRRRVEQDDVAERSFAFMGEFVDES